MTGLNRASQEYSHIVSGVFTPVLAKHALRFAAGPGELCPLVPVNSVSQPVAVM